MSDIQILMATDPEKLTRSDITAIIAEFREKRAAFNAGNLRAGSTKVKPASSKEVDSIIKGISIEGL